MRLVERAAGMLPGDAGADEATRSSRTEPETLAGPPPPVAGSAAGAEVA
jgi:hypothetical protein